MVRGVNCWKEGRGAGGAVAEDLYLAWGGSEKSQKESGNAGSGWIGKGPQFHSFGR